MHIPTVAHITTRGQVKDLCGRWGAAWGCHKEAGDIVVNLSHGFKYQHSSSLVVRPWAGYIMTQYFRFFICKLEANNYNAYP